MSWSLLAMPVHVLARDGMVEWVSQVERSRGVPGDLPAIVALPTAAAVVDAFRSAGCHGTNWFVIVGEAAGSRLPERPDPGACAGNDGRDLGKVSLRSPGRPTGRDPLAPDGPVESVSFRKPNTSAVLRAVCALAQVCGPQLVTDDQADAAFVIWPGERADVLEPSWFW